LYFRYYLGRLIHIIRRRADVNEEDRISILAAASGVRMVVPRMNKGVKHDLIDTNVAKNEGRDA